VLWGDVGPGPLRMVPRRRRGAAEFDPSNSLRRGTECTSTNVDRDRRGISLSVPRDRARSCRSTCPGSLRAARPGAIRPAPLDAPRETPLQDVVSRRPCKTRLQGGPSRRPSKTPLQDRSPRFRQVTKPRPPQPSARALRGRDHQRSAFAAYAADVGRFREANWLLQRDASEEKLANRHHPIFGWGVCGVGDLAHQRSGA
jgi:hypothetical protein